MEALGDIIEQISHAALWIGRDDGAQGAPVWQIPSLFDCLDSLIGFEHITLPGAIIGLLRQTTFSAQQVENF